MGTRQPTWSPSVDDVVNVLLEQNPWRRSGVVPPAWNPPIRRPLAKKLWHRLINDDPRRFQVVLGPRRVGKTTSLYQTVSALLGEGIQRQRLWWLRLDHPLLMQNELDFLVQVALSTAGASNEQPLFLFLDELVYAKNWDLWLKTFYDDAWPVRIAASSSSTAVLKQGRTESGVGRWDEQYLAPYLLTEYLALVGRPIEVPVGDNLASTLDSCIVTRLDTSSVEPQRRRFMLTGGFPELLARQEQQEADEATALLESQRTLRSDAVERAVYKDIPQAFGVDNPMLLERLLYTLGGQICGLLSPTSIAQSLGGMSQPTFDKYVSYLEHSYLVFRLPNYSGSEAARQRRGRKLYFVDGAVRNAALQRGIAPLSDTREIGLLLENLVAGHLHAAARQAQVGLYHWRDGTDEVDLVWDHPTAPLAFEVAVSSTHSRRGLRRFAERYERFRGRCYLVAQDSIARRPQDSDDAIGTLPLDLLLVAAGAQAERDLVGRL